MLPSASIVIEWETSLETPQERVIATLSELARQLRLLTPRFDRPAETIISACAANGCETDIRSVLTHASEGAEWPGVLCLAISTKPLDYYQKKNFGALFANNDVIVFLDADVIPEAGWLESLLACFTDYRKAVVMGRTHLDTRTLYERAVALSWIFVTRSADNVPRVTENLISNNIAFRRALFARLPFPDAPTWRSQCSDLGATLQAVGIRLYEQPAARASHPAHPGCRAFVTRAVTAGVDRHFSHRRGTGAGVGRCAQQWREDMRSVRRRISERRGTLSAVALDIAAAYALGLTYYSIKAVSYLACTLGVQVPGRKGSPSLQE